MLKKIMFLSILSMCFTSCTLSMINTMTSGTAEDVVDSSPTNDVRPETELDLSGQKI